MKPVSLSHLELRGPISSRDRSTISYRVDADAVMKNPFYTPEMPINATGFDTKMNAIVAAAGP
jgi:hypothetical protein